MSRNVSFAGVDLFLSYLPEFRAKTESEVNPLPRYFKVRSLNDFVGGDKTELLLCPVRALRVYIERTNKFHSQARSLFLSPRCPSRSLSKNAISFFLRDVISKSVEPGLTPGSSSQPRSHSIRGMATSAAFLRNFPVAAILEAATWKSPLVFTSFYLKDVQFSHSQGFGLGPFVAAQQILT